MKVRIVISLFAVVVLFVTAIAYVHSRDNFATTAVPKVEVDARFANADQDKDGKLSKEEFANYLTTISRTKQPVTIAVSHSPEPKNVDSGNKPQTPSKEEGGCCGGEDKAPKSTASTEGKTAKKKEGGCCGGEDKAPKSTASTEGKTAKKKEGGCCGGEDKAPKSTASAEGKTAKKKEGGCCGGKDKTETITKQTTPNVKAATLSKELLQNVLAATDALAADDLVGYQKYVPAIVKAVEESTGELHDVLIPFAKKLVTSPDLKSVREPFESFSNTLTAFVKAQPTTERQAKVFQCTMTPVLGTASWLQKDNKEILNPFHGSKMLHCGTEL
jgi:hypothetical protein